MATWPANGDTDWNTKMLAYLAVEHNTDGTHNIPNMVSLSLSTTAYASNPVSSATSWTDIDLSAIVGSNVALVYARVVQVGGTTTDIAFRTKGNAADVGFTATSQYGAGVTAMSLADDNQGYMFIKTDSDGTIQHKAGTSGAGETFNIFVEAYFTVSA